MPTLEVRGVELAWNERGEGPPVLLVHGTAATGAIWGPVAEALARRARAVSYDRRGWGSSTSPDDYRRTTVEEQSEDAAALIESLDAGPAVACGAGAGAVIALDLMLRQPRLIAGAVLIEAPLLQLLPAATEALSEDRRRLETAATEGRDTVELYLSGELPALAAGADRIPEEIAARVRARPGSLIAELGLAAGWRTPLPRLARADRDSMIVTGPSTPPLLREASAALAGRLARSSAREVGSGEGPPHLGAPAEVAAIALELIPG
jgi:pimeloyl-ACP methyl ester carboxylesterase